MDKLDLTLEKMKTRAQEAKQARQNVFPLFGQKNKTIPKAAQFKFLNRRFFEGLLLSLLVVIMVRFLVTETVKYQISIGENRIEAYVNAIMLEGIVIAFAIFKARTSWQKTLRGLMIFFVYFYGICAISGAAVNVALFQQNELRLNQQNIATLEHEVVRMGDLRDRFFKTERTTLARKYEQTLESKNLTLDQLRRLTTQMPSSARSWANLAMAIVLRLLVAASNICCVGMLKRKWGF